MNENTTLLIAKLIERTKSQQLIWDKYNVSSNLLKPEKNDFFVQNVSSYDAFIDEASYCVTYLDTTFFLIATSNFYKNPLVKLYVQTDSSRSSKLYATTDEDDISVTSELKRLYNIVESFYDPIDDSVRSFIGI
ncbi:MAG: hypothetical protein ACI4TK_18800 [Agathobacter sp.]